MTIAERVLREIGRHPDGLKLGEIQRFIVEKCKGGNYDDKIVSYGGKLRRKWAGYWGTNLLQDSMFVRQIGILRSFCSKSEDGRYVLTEKIEPPFFRTRGDHTKTLKRTHALEKKKYQAWRKSLPVCPGCKEHVDLPTDPAASWGLTPDGKAHFDSVGCSADCDCLGRVWTPRAVGPRRLTALMKGDIYKSIPLPRPVNYDLILQWVLAHAIAG